MDKTLSADPRSEKDIMGAFECADQIVLRSYIQNLSLLPIADLETPHITERKRENDQWIDVDREIKASDQSGFFRIGKLVYDSDENNIQKLTNVYSAAAAIQSNVAIIIHSDGSTANMYMGVCGESNRNRIRPNTESLCNYITGNFQGSLDTFENISIDRDELDGLIHLCFSAGQSVVSSVSGVASVRSSEVDDNAEFSQGIEKLLETMRGKPFSAIFIANVVTPGELADLKAEYELLYSSLAPFARSSLSLSDSQTEGVTKTLSESLADTVGKNSSTALALGTSKSDAHTEGTSISKTNQFGVNSSVTASVHAGVHVGPSIAGFSLGGVSSGGSLGTTVGTSYSHSIQRTKSYSDTTTFGKSETNTKTEGTSQAHTVTKTTADGTTESYTVGKTLQLTYENKTIIDLMETIDSQLTRIKACESFGMFATSAYFIAPNKPTAEMAASAYKAIISGTNTGIEKAAINTWDRDTGFDRIAKYLELVWHPVFELDARNKVTPASLVSAQELAIQMGLPKKSVSGITVIESAAFGRNVLRIDEDDRQGKTVHLGRLYHMGQAIDSNSVDLDLQSLSMHTFITGSTGAGKSNTIFQMLSELKKAVTYLVIEPAKGEYKHVFQGRDVSIYGTNPAVTPLLKINPFSFPKEIHILEHLDRLVEIFNACWPMYAAMPAVLKESIERAYTDAGWNLQTSENRYCSNLFPTFADVLHNIKEVMDESAYSADNKGDYTGALSVRIKSLTNGINGMIFTCDSIPDSELFDKNVIVDLSRVGSSETKSLIMGLLVMKLQEYRISQSNGKEQPVKHITVLEEAHNLLKRTSASQSMDSANLAGKSVEMLANAIAEMRAFGEGFIIADQAPGLLDMSVIRNTNTKIIMRLPDQEDRELVGRAAGLTDHQIFELSRLGKGVAAVYQNDWLEAVLCKVNHYKHEDTPYTYEKPHTQVSTQIQSSILDAILRNELAGRIDMVDEEIIKSSLPTQFKCRLYDYLESSSKDRVEMLSKLIYSFFNSSEVMRKISKTTDVSEYKRIALDYLEPSLVTYSEKEKDLVLFLLIHEQSLRNTDFLPLYTRYASYVEGGVR